MALITPGTGGTLPCVMTLAAAGKAMKGVPGCGWLTQQSAIIVQPPDQPWPPPSLHTCRVLTPSPAALPLTAQSPCPIPLATPPCLPVWAGSML